MCSDSNCRVSYDWSNAKDIWSAQPNGVTNCSEMLVEQARRVKTKSPQVTHFVRTTHTFTAP